jgi:hypothetical protein
VNKDKNELTKKKLEIELVMRIRSKKKIRISNNELIKRMISRKFSKRTIYSTDVKFVSCNSKWCEKCESQT